MNDSNSLDSLKEFFNNILEEDDLSFIVFATDLKEAVGFANGSSDVLFSSLFTLLSKNRNMLELFKDVISSIEENESSDIIRAVGKQIPS